MIEKPIVEYYVKSLEDDFETKTIKNKKKVKCQTIDDIIKNKIIKLNTKSFGQKKRLACTLLNKNYNKTYRAQGLIFQTNQKLDYIAPFDLILLTDANKIIVQYYRIKNNLHIYYNHNLIEGYEKFIFNNSKKMFEKYKSPKIAWNAVNKFRQLKGYKKLPKSKCKLSEYNEVIFYKQVKIKPIAIFGYKKIANELAKKHKLPYYTSAKKFYNKNLKK
jgi:hypothetical protein